MSIVLRCGFAFLTLLVLYVFFVIFRQLGEVSLVFNEIVQNGIMAYRVNNDEVIGERQTPSDAYKADYVADIGGKNINGHRDRKRHDHRTSSLFKTDNDNLSEFKRAPNNAKYTRGQFRSHFHEKIFAVEREIFQSLQKQSARELARERPATSTRRNETSVQASSASFLSQGEQQDALSAPEYPENFPASRGARVMILAYQRSGSSFIGEMFNRNPEVFYLFEPIQPIEIATGQGKFPLLYDTLVAHLLHVVYTCSFDKHPYLVNFLSSSPFRLKSQTLTSSGLCEANVTAEHMHRLQREHFEAPLFLSLPRRDKDNPSVQPKAPRINAHVARGIGFARRGNLPLAQGAPSRARPARHHRLALDEEPEGPLGVPSRRESRPPHRKIARNCALRARGLLETLQSDAQRYEAR